MSTSRADLPAAPQGGFAWPVRVYWEDTDAGGIVFYANYLKFFERARTEWLRSLGVEQQALRMRLGGMFVVSQTALRYLRSARLDDELLVTSRLERAGSASLTLAQQAWLLQRTPARADSSTATVHCGPLLCEGTLRIGWVDAQTLRLQRIPECIIDALQP